MLLKDGVIEVDKNERNYINILPREIQERIGMSKGMVLDEVRNDLSGAVENMLLRMENADGFEILQSVVDKVETRNNQGEETGTKEITRYVVREPVAFPDLEIIKQKTKKTSYESKFMENYELLEHARLEILSQKLKSFEQYEPEFKKYAALAQKIRAESPRFDRRSQIENDTERVGYILDNIYQPAISELLVNVAQTYGAAKHDMINTPGNPGVAMWDYDPNLSTFFHHIEEHYNYEDTFAILSKDKKSVFVAMDLDKEDQDTYNGISRTLRNTAATKIINIVSSDDHNNVKGVWKIHKVARDLKGFRSLVGEITARLS